ncbi:polyprenyl synthetase family protein [Candidatus Saccharibacteria bacterium]|nr:polyprenyl synthetase family protein [Candidatus Saccharibacteria bacterium]
MSDLSTHEKAAIQRINETIDAYFAENIQEAAHISRYYEQLWQDMHRLIKSGGKRLRPRMVLRAHKAFGGMESQQVVLIATSQELLHMSLLVHDDVIDRDYVRYGVDNIAGNYFKTNYRAVADEVDRLHYAQSAALLAGDLLISGSYRMMAESGADTKALSAVQAIHSKSIFDVAGGELIDTEAAFREMGDVDAHTVALYKTASYTFVGPLTIGATLAGASSQSIERLKQFAQDLGIAYQLRDDVIGIFGDESTIGKPTISDIREGKHTFMVEEFYEQASNVQKQRFEQYFGSKDVTHDEAEDIKQLLIESGALARTETAITQYAQKADDVLSQIDTGDMSELRELITIVTKRDK